MIWVCSIFVFSEDFFLIFLLQSHMTWQDGSPAPFKVITGSIFDTRTKYDFTLRLKKAPHLVCPPTSICKECFHIRRNQLYFLKRGNSKCVMMIVSNVVDPEWLQVSCFQKITLPTLVCVKRSNNTKHLSKYHKEALEKSCSLSEIAKHKACLSFTWVTNLEQIYHSFCKEMSSHQNVLSLASSLQFLHNAVSPIISPIFYIVEKVKTVILTIEKYLNMFFVKEDVAGDNTGGYQFCERKWVSVTQGNHLFQCTSFVFVSSLYLCDNLSETHHLYSCHKKFCEQVQAEKPVGNDSVCSLLLYQSIYRLCSKYLSFDKPQTTLNFTPKSPAFSCENRDSLDLQYFDDLVPDCADGEDEPHLKSFVQFGSTYNCFTKQQIPCLKGHSKCYNFSDICSYKLDKFQNTFPCRSGAHLESCTEFECNIRFKCSRSYCIPWSYVCDNRWDCPKGEDEAYTPVCGTETSCSHMFRCHNTHSTCIHIGNTCDGTFDCHLHDDEELCELQNTLCPAKCLCLALAMMCKTSSETGFKTGIHFPFVNVHLYNVSSLELKTIKYIMTNLHVISFHKCKINDICGNFFPSKLLFLDVSHNNIQRTIRLCLTDLNLLQQIQLDHNEIEIIHQNSFANLLNLTLLSISNNPLQKIEANIFVDMFVLRLLLIRNLSLTELDVDAFKSTLIEFIVTTEYSVCCIAPNNCTEVDPWFMLCSQMMQNLGMVIVAISLSGKIFVLSLVSGLLHFVARKKAKAYSICVASVNVSDSLLGVYLTILWSSHFVYTDTFKVSTIAWISSSTCFCVLCIIVCFTLTSFQSLVFLSMAKLMVVLQPVKTRFKIASFTLKVEVLFLSLSFSVAVTVSLVVFLFENGVWYKFCFPFIDPSESSTALYISTWIVSCIQVFAAFWILLLHIMLVTKYNQSQQNMEQCKGTRSEKILITPIVVTVLTIILCWCASSVVYLAALFLDRYPIDLIPWTILLIVPLNSVIVPLVLLILQAKKVMP